MPSEKPNLKNLESPRPGVVHALLFGRCPKCRMSRITDGFTGMKLKCSHCDYSLNPESGYFLGAMMIAFFATAFLMVPPMVYLKFIEVDDRVLIAYPFIQYAILGPILIYYAKLLWVYVAYAADHELDKH